MELTPWRTAGRAGRAGRAAAIAVALAIIGIIAAIVVWTHRSPTSTPQRTLLATTLAPLGPRLPFVAPTMAAAKRKEVLEYSCAGCGAAGGACCGRCYANQALAAKRAPPFDSREYSMQEVRCPQCDEILKTKAENACTVDSDGRFRCNYRCDVEPTRTYED